MLVQRDEQSASTKHADRRVRDAFNFPSRWVSEQVEELVAEDWASWEPVVPGLRHTRTRACTHTHRLPHAECFFFFFIFALDFQG